MRAAVLLLVSIASTACEPPPVAPPPASAVPTPAEIAAQSRAAIVTIKASGSSGAGFVVRRDGWIATGLHVIAGATEVKVTFADGSEASVDEVIGLDKDHDLAIVHAAGDKPLRPLSLGDSQSVRPGDSVVSINSAGSVSNSLVSAVLVADPELTVFRLSVPITRSGEPVFNGRGEVIGMTLLVTRQGQSLSFALPISYLVSLRDHPEPMSWLRFTTLSPPRPAGPPRNVPHHELSILQGCTDDEIKSLGTAMEQAIQVGAPLYNSGNHAACFHVYEGASIDAQRKLSPSCRGPAEALADGRARAAALKDPIAQAWAMRDSFDGLFDVMLRKLRGQK